MALVCQVARGWGTPEMKRMGVEVGVGVSGLNGWEAGGGVRDVLAPMLARLM
jgi:hypothetical protein